MSKYCGDHTWAGICATIRKKVLVTKIEPKSRYPNERIPRADQCDWAYCVNEARYYVRQVDQYEKWEKVRGATIV